jgi:hypothetical protein
MRVKSLRLQAFRDLQFVLHSIRHCLCRLHEFTFLRIKTGLPQQSDNKIEKSFSKRFYLVLKRFNFGPSIRSEILKLIDSIWNKEEFPEQWKESIIVPIYKKGDKADCSNYRGISLLSTTYKIQSNILLSRLIPYAEEIIGYHQCGFRRNRSTTDHIFCILQILEKKM